MSQATFFHLDPEGWIVGNDSARGPWSPDGCHAGPVTGMLARAAEQAVPDRQLVRLSVDLVRPAPVSGFQIEVDIERESRSLATTRLTLRNREGKTCATATTMHLSTLDLGDVPTTRVPAPCFDDAEPGLFPVMSGGHDLPTFARSVELAFPGGSATIPGPNTVWMRTHELLPGETMTPYQRLCPLADCGNAMSRNTPGREINFVNTDLTIYVHRLPVSEWIGAEFSSSWESSGIGLARATLFDTEGVIGVAHQTLLLRPQA